MSVVCPSCRNLVESTSTVGDFICTACGSSFRLGEPSATANWTPERRTMGKFELLELVGSGTFGSVYRAKDLELGRTVAVKVPRSADLLEPADAQRFLREARSVASLRHPAIVPVFEIGQDSGRPFLVSEFIDGITLADLLTSERLAPRPAAELVAELADALHYAHEQGVVHRDVKPSNIMLEHQVATTADRRYVPKLMDFGLAKRDVGDATMTVEGQVLGTPAFMSPEQARGDSHSVDGRSDVYSLGVILYQLLTGELPFKGNARMLLHQVLNEEAKPLRQRDKTIPRDLETVCLKAMAKEPSRRYQSAGEFAVDLRRFLADQPILARRSGVVERCWRWTRRNPALAGLSTAVVVLAFVIAAFVFSKTAREQLNKIEPKIMSKIGGQDGGDDLLQVVADLDRTDPGWRFEGMEAARKVVPDDGNGARQIQRFRKAVAEMTGRPRSEGGWEREELRARFRELIDLPPTARMSDADVRDFGEELRRVEPALREARKMKDLPEGRFTLTPTRDLVSIMLPDSQSTRNLVYLLALDARIGLERGERKRAVNDVLGMFHCSAVFNDDPIPINQLVRLAAFHMSVGVLECTLAHGVSSDEELANLQTVILKESDESIFATMVRGDRAALHYSLGSLATGDATKTALEAVGAKDRSELPSASEIRRFHAWLLRHQTRGVDAARRPPHEWMKHIPSFAEYEMTDPVFASLFSGQAKGLVVNAKNFAAPALRHLALARSAAAGLAVERYRLARGDWPKDLASVVPTYLKDVPKDPYDGKPLLFRRTANGVVVYSLGPNEADDGGKIHRTGALENDGKPLPFDIGFEWFDPAKRVNAGKRQR